MTDLINMFGDRFREISLLFLFLLYGFIFLTPPQINISEVSPIYSPGIILKQVYSTNEGFGITDVSSHINSQGNIEVIASAGSRGVFYKATTQGYTQLTGPAVSAVIPQSSRIFSEGPFLYQSIFYDARLGSYNSQQDRLGVADNKFGTRVLHLGPEVTSSLVSPITIPGISSAERYTATDVILNTYPYYFAFDVLSSPSGNPTQYQLVKFEPNTGVKTVLASLNYGSSIVDGAITTSAENMDPIGMSIKENSNGAEKIFYVTENSLRVIDLTVNPFSVSTLLTQSSISQLFGANAVASDYHFTDLVYDGSNIIYIVGQGKLSFILAYNVNTQTITPILITSPGSNFGSFSDIRTKIKPSGIDLYPNDNTKLIIASNGYVAVLDLINQVISQLPTTNPALDPTNNIFVTTYIKNNPNEQNMVGVYVKIPNYGVNQYIGNVGPIPVAVGFSPSAAIIKDLNGDNREDIAVGVPSLDQVWLYDGQTMSKIGTVTGSTGSGFGSKIFSNPSFNSLDGSIRLIVKDSNGFVSSWKSTPSQNGNVGAILESYISPPTNALPGATSKFGESVAACVDGGSRWFAVGAPGINSVFVYNVNNPSATPTQITLSQMGTNSVSNYGEFGKSIVFTDSNCNLLIGSPGVGSGLTNSLLTNEVPVTPSAPYLGPNPYPLASATEIIKRSGATFEIDLTSSGQFGSLIKKIDGQEIYSGLHSQTFPALSFTVINNAYFPPFGYWNLFTSTDANKIRDTSELINSRIGDSVGYSSSVSPPKRILFSPNWGIKQDTQLNRYQLASDLYPGLPGALIGVGLPNCFVACFYTQLFYVPNIMPRFEGLVGSYSVTNNVFGGFSGLMRGTDYSVLQSSYPSGSWPSSSAIAENTYYPNHHRLLADFAQFEDGNVYLFEKDTGSILSFQGNVPYVLGQIYPETGVLDKITAGVQ